MHRCLETFKRLGGSQPVSRVSSKISWFSFLVNETLRINGVPVYLSIDALNLSLVSPYCLGTIGCTICAGLILAIPVSMIGKNM